MASRDRSKTVYASILCAVDFSLPSTAALQMAAHIARRGQGRLTAIYVEDPLLSTGAAAAGYDTSLIRESTLRQLDRLMRRIAKSTALPDDAWTIETVPGRPAQAIAKVAKDLKADLIVMGTNGRRGPAKLVFGSVADAVLRRTSVPVLAVSRSKPGRKELRIENRPILGAIDLGPNEAADARRQARAAAGFGGALTLLHVARPAPELPGITPELDQDRQLARIDERLRRLAKRVGARSRVVPGAPEDQIVAVANDINAGLIILSLRRGRGLLGPRRGTTTYRILSGSMTPVLALPPVGRR